MTRAKLTRWVALLVLVIGFLRLFHFAGHEPLWGYANQYDMARTSACLGLWPDRADAAYDAPHVSAPLLMYRTGGPRSDACFPSAEVAVVAGAVWVHGLLRADQENEFDLQLLALWKASLAALVALSLHIGLRRHVRWQLGFSVVFTGLVADPFNLLYLAGLYTEFTALLGAWLAVGMMAILVLRRRSGEDVGWAAALGLSLGLLLLGTARMQHVLHPLALLALLGVFWWRVPFGRVAPHSSGGATWTPLLPAFVAVVAVIGFQASNQQRQRSIANANKINSVFAALLPASDEPEAMIRRMDLPEHCVALNHVSWYLHLGHEPQEECPEVSGYSRLWGAWALMREPLAILRLVGRGLLHSSVWRLPYLGEIAGESFARAPTKSIASPLAVLGFVPLVMLWAVPFLPGAVISWRLVRGRADSLDLVGLLLMAWIVLTWTASLLGDGYSELSRHLHLAQNALLALWLWLAGWVWSSMAGLAGKQRRHWLWRVGLSGSTLLALLLFAVFWSRIPMAIGHIRSPDGEAPVDGHFAVTGWVLASNKVTAMRATLGDAPPAPLALQVADVELRGYFKAGNGQLATKFSGELSWPDSAGTSAVLRVQARDNSAEWREINAVLLHREPQPLDPVESSAGRDER